jgi:16S rRNA processing protein RimM
MPDWEDMVLVGRVARPHGIRGHVVVNPETDFVEDRFAPGGALWTRSGRGDERLTIASARIQGGRPVIAFDGFASIDEVERLAGLELRVPEDALQPLESGSYYQHQLVGCEVDTTGGERVGTVTRVEGAVGGTLLVVDGRRGEILIPFAVDICVDVDVVAKRIRIAPIEGLLELNEPGPARAGRDVGRAGGDGPLAGVD